MTAKKAKVSKASKIKVKAEHGQSREAVVAQLAIEPCMTAAMVSTAFSRMFGDVSLTATHTALLDATKRVHNGNMRKVESTLVAQAAALNSIFTDLARRAALNAGEYLSAAETYMKLALRAQNQCRMTLETLATIKTPPVVFAKQANIAHGHQQVNNGRGVPVSPARETENGQTELLEAPHAKPEWMDAGAPAAASRNDSRVAAMETRDRPTNGGG
jgi:hypothetical protein